MGNANVIYAAKQIARYRRNSMSVMSMPDQYICAILEQNPLAMVAIYVRPEDTERFFVGNLLFWQSDSFICLRTISLEGAFDGYFMCNPAYIYRYETDCNYLRRFSDALSLETDALPAFHDWESCCAFAQQEKCTVQILGRNCRNLAKGRVVACTKDSVTIQRVCTDGADGKQCRFFFSNMVGILCCMEGGEQ